MATERQIQETIARCVSIVVFFHNSQKSPKMRSMMVAEVQAIAGWVEELGLCGMATDEQILVPVEWELVARYGPVAGRRAQRRVRQGVQGLGRARPVACHGMKRHGGRERLVHQSCHRAGPHGVDKPR